jgi:hypothetical protein
MRFHQLTRLQTQTIGHNIIDSILDTRPPQATTNEKRPAKTEITVNTLFALTDDAPSAAVGAPVGAPEGTPEGAPVGAPEGAPEGASVVHTGS